jgi:hypothetical protein
MDANRLAPQLKMMWQQHEAHSNILCRAACRFCSEWKKWLFFPPASEQATCRAGGASRAIQMGFLGINMQLKIWTGRLTNAQSHHPSPAVTSCTDGFLGAHENKDAIFGILRSASSKCTSSHIWQRNVLLVIGYPLAQNPTIAQQHATSDN